jgi:2-phosphosulfolactate phosphatase
VPRIDVYLLPQLAPAGALREKTVVVIDVLRATTTMVSALANGASGILPCLEVEEARRKAGETRGAVLGGERAGLPLEGFDLGNSPADYQAERVANRTVVFTTTNGTRAIRACAGASRLLMAALVNRHAVSRQMAQERQVAIVCAGTRGEISSEDVLLAGALLETLSELGGAFSDGDAGGGNDQAWLARSAWRNLHDAAGNLRGLSQALRQSRGGRNLANLGMHGDIDFAAQLDRFEIVPELDTRDGLIRVK